MVIYVFHTVTGNSDGSRGFLCESQTICALLVKDHTVVALCPVGLYDIWSSNMSVCVGFP